MWPKPKERSVVFRVTKCNSLSIMYVHVQCYDNSGQWLHETRSNQKMALSLIRFGSISSSLKYSVLPEGSNSRLVIQDQPFSSSIHSLTVQHVILSIVLGLVSI